MEFPLLKFSGSHFTVGCLKISLVSNSLLTKSRILRQKTCFVKMNAESAAKNILHFNYGRN